METSILRKGGHCGQRTQGPRVSVRPSAFSEYALVRVLPLNSLLLLRITIKVFITLILKSPQI